MEVYKLIKSLWSFFSKKRKIQTFLLIILMVVSSFAELISIGVVIPFIGFLVSPDVFFEKEYLKFIFLYFNIQNEEELLLPLTAFFCFAIVIAAILRILLLFIQTKLSYFIGGDLNYLIYKKTLYQPFEVHISRNSSEVISVLTSKTNTVVTQFIVPIYTILSSFLVIIFILSALLYVDLVSTFFLFFVSGFLYLILIVLTKNKLKKNSNTINAEQTKVLKNVQEGMEGIREILIDGTQNFYANVFRASEFNLRKSWSSTSIIGASPRLLIEALGILLITIIAYFLKIKGGIDAAIPILAAIALGSARILPLMQQVYGSISYIRNAKASLREVLKLLNQKLPDIKDLDKERISFANNIKIRNLKFHYKNSTNLIFENANMIINKGDRVGIIGPSGTGKSTLVNIIMGLIKITSGQLLIDNKQILENNIRSWQKNISHVPQFIYISDSSILENIAFGMDYKNIDHDRVIECAKKANIDDFINSLENKYNTKLGERGIKISGGQKQRIGIARALYKNSNLIILDEPTSALDEKTEKEVMSTIYNISSELTVIIIAHRKSTLKQCNKIIEIKDRKILNHEINKNFE